MGTYAFECSCPRRRFFTFEGHVGERCDVCEGVWRLTDVVNPALREGCTVEDVTFTPKLAAGLLDSARSVEGPNDPRKVARYAQLMRTGGWVHMTLERGGENCPIVIDDEGHLRYGLQRLEACIQAGVPFRAVLVRWVPARVPA